jgi:hypothetical protein
LPPGACGQLTHPTSKSSMTSCKSVRSGAIVDVPNLTQSFFL